LPLTAVIAGITHWHAPRYVRILRARGVRLLGAADADAGAGRAASQRYDIAFEADTDRLLEKTRPDLALLLPRHDLATREITAVAARGVAMLLEKPMGRNGREAAASAAAVRRAGIFASVCLPNRYLGIWDAYRALVADDALGTLLHAHFRTINGPASRYIDYGVPWMLDPDIAGGGALRNLGIHGADAICQLAAGRPLTMTGASISHAGHDGRIEDFAAACDIRIHGADAICQLAAGRPLTMTGASISHAGHDGRIEDFAAAVCATADGFIATLEAGYTYANQQEGGDYEWRIAATAAYLHECNGRLRVHRRGATIEERAVPTPHLAYEIMVNAALDAFEAGAAPPATVDDCVFAVDLQDRIYATAAMARTPD